MASASSAQAPSRSLRPASRPEGIAPPQAARTAKPATASKPAPPTPARRAASSGGGTQSAKPAAKPAAGTAKPKVNKQAVASWQQGIARALVRANRRPKTTATGRVALIISVTPAGRLASVRVARSSGNKTLDRAAVANVKRARLPRAPKGFGQIATVRFTYDFTR
jgi:protein TonB